MENANSGRAPAGEPRGHATAGCDLLQWDFPGICSQGAVVHDSVCVCRRLVFIESMPNLVLEGDIPRGAQLTPRLDHSWWCCGDPLGCLGSNLGWPCARLARCAMAPTCPVFWGINCILLLSDDEEPSNSLSGPSLSPTSAAGVHWPVLLVL